LGADAGLDVRPRLAATVINGANRAAIDLWVAGGGKGDLIAMMAEAVKLMRPSINSIARQAKQARADVSDDPRPVAVVTGGARGIG
jgi:hypothetical protein